MPWCHLWNGVQVGGIHLASMGVGCGAWESRWAGWRRVQGAVGWKGIEERERELEGVGGEVVMASL